MHDRTYPPTATRGNGAALALILCTVAAVALAALSLVHPEPLGGVAFVALVLGVVGLVAALVGEGVSR